MKILLTIIFISLLNFNSFCQDSPDPVGYEKMSQCSICLLGQKFDDKDLTSFLAKYDHSPKSFIESGGFNSLDITLSYNNMKLVLDDNDLVYMIRFNLESGYEDSATEEISEILDYWGVSSDYDESEDYLCEYQDGKVEEMDNDYTRIYTESDFHPYKLEMIWYDDLLNSLSISLNDQLGEISQDFFLLGQCLEIKPWGEYTTEEENNYSSNEYESTPDESGDEIYEVESEESAYNNLTYENNQEEKDASGNSDKSNSPSINDSQSGKTALDYYTLGMDGTPEQMIEYNTKAIELDPSFVEAYCNRGTAYSRLQKYQEAIGNFTRSVEIDPEFATGYYNRASVYAALGDNTKSADDLKKYIILNGNDDGNEEDVKTLIFKLTGEKFQYNNDIQRVQDQKDWLLLGYNVPNLFLLLSPHLEFDIESELKNLDFSPLWERIIFIETLLNHQGVSGKSIEDFNELKRLVDESRMAIQNYNEDTYLKVVGNTALSGAQIALLRLSLKTYVKKSDTDWRISNKFGKLLKAGDVLADLQILLTDGEDLEDVRKCNKPCMKDKLINATKACKDAEVYENLVAFFAKTFLKVHNGKADTYVCDYITGNMDRLLKGDEVIIGF